MIKIGIYKITNIQNNNCYIGQSRNIYKRWNTHKNTAFREDLKEYEYPLYRAIRKYGLENFTFEIIEECLIEELNDKEIEWIKKLKPEYNQTVGGELRRQSVKSKLSAEDVDKIQELLKTTNITIKDLASQYNVHRDTIRDINVGRSWRTDGIKYPIRISKFDASRHVSKKCIDCGIEIYKTSTRCVKCENEFRKNKSIKELPVTREELKDLIRNRTFTDIGLMFNISANGIKKWCIKLNLPSKKKDIKTYSDEEWVLI